jgi:hypothetical protein
METNKLIQQSASTYRVVEVVIGGGYQLRPGQVIGDTDLGDFASILLQCGAIEFCGSETQN